MNNSTETKGFWIPYKIPPTPNISNDDVYALTCSNGADSTKNPSQFLSWKLLPSSGGGGSTCSSLGLYFKTNNDNTTLWIASGVINGTPIAEQEIANSGSGFVLAKTIINESQGTVVESGVIKASPTPKDTFTTFYFPIGFYNFTNNFVRQDHCGTIFGYSCRVQYSSPARFSWRYYS